MFEYYHEFSIISSYYILKKQTDIRPVMNRLQDGFMNQANI